jgi:hypothetical protein
VLIERARVVVRARQRRGVADARVRERDRAVAEHGAVEAGRVAGVARGDREADEEDGESLPEHGAD